MNDTIVLYHDNCIDGFGAAYAAWKKFGDSATYIPVSRGDTPPVASCTNKNVYLVDFCFEDMTPLVAVAAHLCVLDHHRSDERQVRTMPEYVYDDTQSGSTITWRYFHPDTPIPALLLRIEDGDLYRNALPETRALFTLLEVTEKEFSVWDAYVRWFEDEVSRKALMDKAHTYEEYFNKLVDISVNRAKLVRFEGYEVYFGYTHPMMSMKSVVGNTLVQKKGPLALVVTAHPDGFGVSIRGDGSVDVSKIASKFGGGGHPNSSGFLIPKEGPFPWELITDDENSSN